MTAFFRRHRLSRGNGFSQHRSSGLNPRVRRLFAGAGPTTWGLYDPHHDRSRRSGSSRESGVGVSGLGPSQRRASRNAVDSILADANARRATLAPGTGSDSERIRRDLRPAPIVALPAQCADRAVGGRAVCWMAHVYASARRVAGLRSSTVRRHGCISIPPVPIHHGVRTLTADGIQGLPVAVTRQTLSCNNRDPGP